MWYPCSHLTVTAPILGTWARWSNLNRSGNSETGMQESSCLLLPSFHSVWDSGWRVRPPTFWTSLPTTVKPPSLPPWKHPKMSLLGDAEFQPSWHRRLTNFSPPLSSQLSPTSALFSTPRNEQRFQHLESCLKVRYHLWRENGRQRWRKWKWSSLYVDWYGRKCLRQGRLGQTPCEYLIIWSLGKHCWYNRIFSLAGMRSEL